MKNIPLFKVFMAPTAKDEVGKVLDSGYIGQGPQVDKFEHNLREYFNYDYLTTLNSGTSALHLALHLLKKPDTNENEWSTYNWPGLKDGDEVLCTSLTCTASNFPVLANGLKIKWVDVDPKTLNMDLDDLERKISPTTKAIIGVHWGGYPLDLDRIKKIQNKSLSLYGFSPALIEDCAHAFGSEYKGRKLGNHGNISMYSLQAIKHITAVDGGILFLPHQKLFDRAKLVRWYGINREDNRKDFRCEADIEEWGFKFHMNDVNATVGIENLKHADKIVSKNRNNGHFYDRSLINTDGVTLLDRNPEFNSSFWLYSMLVEDRDGFYKWMKECNITVSQVHERNDKHTCVRDYKTFLPTLDNIVNNVVSIPVGWWVTKDEREYIVDCIKKGW